MITQIESMGLQQWRRMPARRRTIKGSFGIKSGVAQLVGRFIARLQGSFAAAKSPTGDSRAELRPACGGSSPQGTILRSPEIHFRAMATRQAFRRRHPALLPTAPEW